jgi:hypothetical protein
VKKSTVTMVVTALLFLLMASMSFATPTNVALNKTVSINGAATYGGSNVAGCTPQAIAAASVDDGFFYPEQTCWTFGFAWSGLTSATDTAHYVDIDLGGAFDLSSAIVQADDNDTYILQYEDLGGTYHDWWAIGAPGGFGLTTRPSGDQVTQQSLPSVEAIGLRFMSTGGDGFYSVSEIQTFGNQVPEPGTLLLLGSGVVGIANTIRKRVRR